MKRAVKKRLMHERRRRRIRGRLAGTVERPRLVVSRSHKQIYVQIIDDVAGSTLCSASSLAMSRSDGTDGTDGTGGTKGGNIAGARAVGAEIARKATAAGIARVCFDRGGNRYHGRVKALADAAREAGLDF